MGGQLDLISCLNGEFMLHSEVVSNLQDEETQSAGGFYDSQRTFAGEIFKLRQHLTRLNNSLVDAKIDCGFTVDEVEQLSLKTLEINRSELKKGDEFVVTQIVNLVPAQLSSDKPQANVIIFCQFLDFSRFAYSYANGVRITTPSSYAVPITSANCKSGIYRQRSYFLMADIEGSITECQGGNFMFVKDGRIKLPDRRNVLPGISMQTILELANKLNIPVDEADYTVHDVYMAEEAFVSSTRFCLVPVDTVNGLRLDGKLPGMITGLIQEAWCDLVGVDFIQQAFNQTITGDM